MEILRRSAGQRTGAGEFVEFLKVLQDLLFLTESSYSLGAGPGPLRKKLLTSPYPSWWPSGFW